MLEPGENEDESANEMGREDNGVRRFEPAPAGADDGFEYEVVDPDAYRERPEEDPESLIRGREELEAIEQELAGSNGGLARWGALLMFLALLLMLAAPRMGCRLKDRPSRELLSP